MHRGGFKLAYRPPFLRRITQNAYVHFANEDNLHKVKNMCLGQGLAAGGYGYDCHVFFPHLQVRNNNTTHLTDKQQTEWLNDIVIPALRGSCGNDILQHHP